ncbi:hypothetical protein Tco_0370054 [Tanacetum coccineum]
MISRSSRSYSSQVKELSQSLKSKITISYSQDEVRFGVRSVHREDRPPNLKFFPGSFNLVDYDNSRDYKQTRDYGRATRDAERDIRKLKRTLESASKGVSSHARKSNEEAVNDKRKPMNDYGVSNLDNHLVSNNARDYASKEEELNKERECELLKDPYKIPPTCKIERFEVIKYSFRLVEEFVAIKEYGYNDWMKTKEDVCHAYRDIFTKMDEGWFVTRAE